MKKILYLLFIGFAVLQSCSKNKDGNSDSSGLSQDIQNFVPEAVIDSMRSWGFIINEGKTPPVINGVYSLSRNYCTFDNSGFGQANTYFADYHYKFQDQDNAKLTINLNYKVVNTTVSDTASGTGSFVSGTGNDFTVFTDVKGLAEGVTYEWITFCSGTITDNGIQNFQFGLYVKDKGPDPNNELINIGSARIFKDDDGLAEKIPNYRIGKDIGAPGRSPSSFPVMGTRN